MLDELAQTGVKVDRASFPLAVSNIRINLGSPIPIYKQICSAIRTAIVRGELPAGTLLPTSHELASALSVGRNTIISAYSRLGAEGYLESKFRRGTRVATRLSPQTTAQSGGADAAEISTGPGADPQIGIAYSTEHTLREAADCRIDNRPFAPYAPDPTLFPRNQVSRLLSEACASGAHPESGSDTGAELKRFQTAVAAHLRQTNGIVCQPGQIVPTIGAESAIDLIARLMIDPGHVVQIEDPSWNVPRTIFQNVGARLFNISSDSLGANPQLAVAPPARLIYVSPSVSFPFGGQMPAERRRAIVDHARASGALILENDFYGELLFAGARLPAIQTLEASRVVYHGSFYCTLGPKIRTGYLVVPEAYVDPLAKFCRIVAPGPDQIVLSALATLIETGRYAIHAKRTRAIYLERMARLVEMCRARIPQAAIVEPCGGLHLSLILPAEIPAATACRLAQPHGIGIVPLEQFYSGTKKENGILLGIGTCHDRQIDSLVSKLADFIHEATAQHAGSRTAAE
jgi:GntR family transcriptional regulator/MocR family aminotransferase